MKLQSLLHFRTDIKDKLPQSNEIELGEIAINHATDGETLFIKNNDGEIAGFKDTKYYSKITDDIYSKLDTINNTIEENELVTAAALTDLNERVTLVENGEIGNPFFKSFATLSEYETAVENGEVVYPCVAFIEEDGTIEFMTNVVYNAKVTLGEEYVTLVGNNLKSQLGFYPLCFTDYFDSVIVDGVEMIDTAEPVTIDGETLNVIRFPSEEIGDSCNVSFKVKEEPEILVSATDSKISSNTAFLSPFCGCLSYIKIDESFHKRGLSTDSNTYYNMCCLNLSMNRNFNIKFVGDYFSAPVMNSPYLLMLLYGQFMLAEDPNINLNVTLSIPSGNTTYGTPDDVFVEDDTNTHTFYAEYNYIQNFNESHPNLNISVETY